MRVRIPAGVKPIGKAVVGGLGLFLTVASAWYGPDGTTGQLVTMAIAILSGFGIWRVPNLPALPVTIAALKAAQVRSRTPPRPPAAAR